jgi:hypothetical protein
MFFEIVSLTARNAEREHLDTYTPFFFRAEEIRIRV